MNNATTSIKGHPERGEFVPITINGKEYQVHRGSESVSALKTLANISQADVLEEFVNGKFEPLPDEGKVVIKGDEKFVSKPRSAGSS